MNMPVSFQPTEFQEGLQAVRYAIAVSGSCFTAAVSGAFYLFLYCWEPPADGPMHRDAPTVPGIWEDEGK